MLKKLRKPEDICEERYTLNFYKNYYENTKILEKYEQQKSFYESEAQKKNNRLSSSSWKDRKYQRAGPNEKDRNKHKLF